MRSRTQREHSVKKYFSREEISPAHEWRENDAVERSNTNKKFNNLLRL